MIRVVLAPSGAGKTYAARAGYVVDGDTLPAVAAAYKRLRHRFGDKWWENDKSGPVKVRLLGEAYATELGRTGSRAKPIGTAEDKAILPLIGEGVLDPSEVVWFAPTPEQLTANQRDRANRQRALYGEVRQPEQSLERNSAYLRDFVFRMGAAQLRRVGNLKDVH